MISSPTVCGPSAQLGAALARRAAGHEHAAGRAARTAAAEVCASAHTPEYPLEPASARVRLDARAAASGPRADSWAARSSVSSSGSRSGRAVAALQREGDQVVGQPGVLGQQRAVQVGADQVVAAHALEPVAAVVAEAVQHPAEGAGAVAEVGAAAVVLEAGDRRAARRRARPRSRRCRSGAAPARAPSRGRRCPVRAASPRRAGSCGRAAGSRRRRRAGRRRRRRPRRAPRACVATMSAATARWSRSWPPPM